jgi:hypothetical protein
VLHEPDVALTDLALALETGAFALLTARQESFRHQLGRLTSLLFLCLAASSLLGGAYHGWFPLGTATAAGQAVWTLTMLSIGAAATTLWLLAGALTARPPRWLVPAALALLLTYSAVVLFVDDHFWVSIAFSVPPLVALLGIFLAKIVKLQSKGAAFGFSAILLMFLASTLQQLRVGVHPTYFNHNALYHLIQGIALALLFYGLRLFLRAP